MSTKTTLLALALGVTAAFSLRAETRSAGYVICVDGTWHAMTNVVDNVLHLSNSDLPASPQKICFSNRQQTGVTVWGSYEVTVDFMRLSVTNDLVIMTEVGEAQLFTIKSRGTNSIFTISQTNGYTVAVSNLNFVGCNQSLFEFAPYDGAAINQTGGRLTIDNCTFKDLVSRFSGGAVSARNLWQDSYVKDCKFDNNRSQPINGYGGALYASGDIKANGGAPIKFELLGKCEFTNNTAENGGAISTVAICNDDEIPLDLVVPDGTETYFEDNYAVYEGGAIIAEGGLDFKAASTNTFCYNTAELGGGAICTTGIVGDDAITPESYLRNIVFNGNTVSNDATWTCGGAVAVMHPIKMIVEDCVFSNNVSMVASCNEPAFGGAYFQYYNVTSELTHCWFDANNTATNFTSAWCYGGAISASTGEVAIARCVVMGGQNDYCAGSSIDLNATDFAKIINTTCRSGKTEALSVYDSVAAITNCVFIGNNTGLNGLGDLYYYGNSTVTMGYSAYGSNVVNSTVSLDESHVLTNCTAASTFMNETSPQLKGDGFNPVAGLGLVQVENDYNEIAYGSCDYGYSMGAFETNTVKFATVLNGDKYYDGDASSNNCTMTWSYYTNAWDNAGVYGPYNGDTSGWQDVLDVDRDYVLTDWAFDSPNVGYYASTNGTLTATLSNTSERVEWLNTIVTNIFTGSIITNSNIQGYLDPTEYAWTGSEIKPGESVGTLVVSNTQYNIEIPSSEYYLTWINNTDPVDRGGDVPGPNSACVIITCTNNYAGAVFTNTFGITAYTTTYKQDSTVVNVTTNGTLSGSNVWAVVDVPEYYCLDWQNSVTNKDNVSKAIGAELTVWYKTDINVPGGDDIPDEYQKRVVFATILGNWDGTSNGYDVVQWVTLTNTASGDWDYENGVGILDLNQIPGVGNIMYNGFTNAAWIEPLPTTNIVNAGSTPIYLAKPQRAEDPSSGRTRNSQTIDAEIVETVAITDFMVDENGTVSGAIEYQFQNTQSGEAVRSAVLESASIQLYGAATLDGEWTLVGETKTDREGFWEIKRVRSTNLSATRTSNGDRTWTWDVSSSAAPKFFKVVWKKN